MIEKLNIDPTQSVATNHCIINKINELVDTVNKQQIQLNNHECRLLDLHSRITALEDPTYHEAEPEPAENVLTKSLRMDKEFAEAECVRLQNELERTRKALGIAVDALKEIDELLSSNKFDVREVPLLNITQTKISMLLRCINIEQITALEQKD